MFRVLLLHTSVRLVFDGETGVTLMVYWVQVFAATTAIGS